MKALARLRTESLSLQKAALFVQHHDSTTPARQEEGKQGAGGGMLVPVLCVVLLGGLGHFLRSANKPHPTL